MTYLLTTLCLLLFGASQATSGDPPILSFEEFESYFKKSNDTTYVVNFWATWCKPCVEELPFFEDLRQDFLEQPVHVLLVSLDFKHQIDSKLIPFIEKNELQSEVLVLYAPDANAWIDKVDKRWTGAIPATVVFRNGRQVFHGEKFESYSELKSMVESINKI
ncbi:MAG: TlpA family protein disulfide reductase [Saprospiraceae bacterium]|nr:TlpA family protein disulfide reductase [Saprospiraceae bacterium]